MTMPVIAITNASTCLSDAEVAAAIPALQRQVTLDFRAYWEVDCQLTLLPREEPLVRGVVADFRDSTIPTRPAPLVITN